MKLAIFDLDDTLYSGRELFDDTLKSLDEIFKNLEKITLLPHAYDVLNKLDAKKILVTKALHGDDIVNKKIDILNLRDLFEKIITTKSDKEKLEVFKRLLNEYNANKEETFVIGDRIDSEIRYGKELGLKTILIKRGKYENLKPKDDYEIPDYTITDLRELFEIIK